MRLIEFQDQTMRHSISLIAYKLSLEMWHSFVDQLSDFHPPCRIFKYLTLPLIRPDFFLGSSYTVFYAIQFWTCFSGSMSRLASVKQRELLEETAADIVQVCYRLISELFVNYSDEAVTNFIVHRNLKSSFRSL
jgi:hypothetical protein